MGDAGPAGGWRFEIVDVIGSTSDALIKRAVGGEAGRVALLARRQFTARGSRGRKWIEPPAGNLAMSVMLRPRWTPSDVENCVFAAGLALRAALQRWVVGGASLALKWPNDVMLDGRKLGGVLVETALGAQGRLGWLVVGFGANLLEAPLVPGRRTACLAECAEPAPDAAALGVALLSELDCWFELLERDRRAVRDSWLEVAHPAGTMLTVDGVEGRFAGLSAQGDLLLQCGERLEVVRTGDVVLAGC